MIKKFVSGMIDSRKVKVTENVIAEKLSNRVAFLAGASSALISDLAAEVIEVNYTTGETVLEEGEQGESLYLIVEGTVSISNRGNFLAELGVGGCFGEGALLTDKIRKATVVANQNLTLYRLNKESFATLTEKYSKVRFCIRRLHEERIASHIEQSIEHKLLQNAPFLSGVGKELIRELAQILSRKHFEKGDLIIKEGEKGEAFYLIEDGLIGVSKDSNLIAELGPGSCLGEGSLLSGQPCSATVNALSDADCFVMTKGGFQRIMERYPVVHKRLQAIHKERQNS